MATEEQKAANQKAFDQMVKDTRFLAEHLDEVVFQKMMDLANYKVRDASGEEKSILDLVRDGGGIFRELPWYGFDGTVQPEGARRVTSIAGDVPWTDSRIAGLSKQVLTLQETVKAIGHSTGAVIDIDAIARAVADEEDRRNRERLAEIDGAEK